jgi:hypothetical protein
MYTQHVEVSYLREMIKHGQLSSRVTNLLRGTDKEIETFLLGNEEQHHPHVIFMGKPSETSLHRS